MRNNDCQSLMTIYCDTSHHAARSRRQPLLTVRRPFDWLKATGDRFVFQRLDRSATLTA